MSDQPLIKITKKDKTFHIVPASQRKMYESFNAKAVKFKKPNDVVTIEDYEEPVSDPADAKKDSLKNPPADKLRPAKDVIADIGNATTIADVDALIKDDKRTSVIAAADAKKDSLK